MVIFNHYVKTRVTVTTRPGPGPGKLGPGPARKIIIYQPGPGPCLPGSGRTRPGPQNIIIARPGLWAAGPPDPAHWPKPGPCRTIMQTMPFAKNTGRLTRTHRRFFGMPMDAASEHVALDLYKFTSIDRESLYNIST